MSILDIGTGSGNIIIALAKALDKRSMPIHGLEPINRRATKHQFFASDISPAALKIAKQNAKRHGVSISFKQSDILQGWKKQQFDVIVANLPYLAKQTDPSTKFEPTGALIAKNNGLALYEMLFKQITMFPPLRKQGSSQNKTPHQVRGGKKIPSPQFIFIEFDPRQTRQLKKLADKLLPAYETKIFRDLAARPRYAVISCLPCPPQL